jgi:hypothetical protein
VQCDRTPVDVACFWDSLEHIHNPTPLLQNVRRWVFTSLPIFRNLAVAGALVGALVQQRARRRTWQHALPPGYNLALLGAVIFGCGGVGDMLWHTLFGIEKDVEALFSPTHIMLACGAWLMVGGPFCAAWQRFAPPEVHWHQHLPSLLSLTWMLSTGTFMTQIAHPVVYLWEGEPPRRPAGWQALRGRYAVGYLLPDGICPVNYPAVGSPRFGALTLVIGSTRWLWGFSIVAPIPSSPCWHGSWPLWGREV